MTILDIFNDTWVKAYLAVVFNSFLTGLGFYIATHVGKKTVGVTEYKITAEELRKLVIGEKPGKAVMPLSIVAENQKSGLPSISPEINETAPQGDSAQIQDLKQEFADNPEKKELYEEIKNLRHEDSSLNEAEIKRLKGRWQTKEIEENIKPKEKDD